MEIEKHTWRHKCAHRIWWTVRTEPMSEPEDGERWWSYIVSTEDWGISYRGELSLSDSTEPSLQDILTAWLSDLSAVALGFAIEEGA